MHPTTPEATPTLVDDLARVMEPYPVPVRTLDALHLASLEFLRGLGQRPVLATYDRRWAGAPPAFITPPAVFLAGSGVGAGGRRPPRHQAQRPASTLTIPRTAMSTRNATIPAVSTMRSGFTAGCHVT